MRQVLCWLFGHQQWQWDYMLYRNGTPMLRLIVGRYICIRCARVSYSGFPADDRPSG